jgi:hypothetical protein
VEGQLADGELDTGWGSPMQRLDVLAERCFARGLSAREAEVYDDLAAEVARTCGTTPEAVARLLVRRQLARRKLARRAEAPRAPAQGIEVDRPRNVLHLLPRPEG